MDHDSIPFGLPGPTSARSVDVRDAYARITHHGLRAMGEKINGDRAYASNEEGHLAWDVSLLVRAACLAWRVTGSVDHLQRAVSWAQHLMDRTDAGIGRDDWRGRRGPVWSAGARYTAGTAVVGNVDGIPVRLQAAAARVIIERPSDTTAIVRAVSKDGHVWSTPETSLLPDDANYLPDVLARRSVVYSVLIRGLDAPTPLTSVAAGEYVLEPQHAAHLVHTGMIARSLICVAEALTSSGRPPSETTITAEDLYTAAERALRFHDDEIRCPTGSAWYITPEDFPTRRLGLELPHNHVVDAASSFLLLGRHRHDQSLHDLGTSLAGRFMRELAAFEAGRLEHPWFYYPVDSAVFSGVTRQQPLAERFVPAVPRAEDSSHATMRVRALSEWKAMDDRLIPDATMTTVALAFRRFFMASDRGVPTLRWLPGDEEGAARQGLSDTYAGAWGALAPWDASIQRRINTMAFRHPPRAAFGATVLSAAEIFALNSTGARCAPSGRTVRA